MSLMDLAMQRDWKGLFALAVEGKEAQHREEQMKLFYKDLDHDRDKQHEASREHEKETKQFLEAATAAQLATFDQHLDAYDTQTVHALMENGEALDKLRMQTRQMEESAYVLPDGRRAFKTQDGQRVFDEHGAEISHDVIDPRMIADRHTQWEPLKAVQDAKFKLETERQGLVDYQSKLDDARSRSSHGDMSKKQLDDLDADLKASAPPSVRQKLGLQPTEATTGTTMRGASTTPTGQPAIIDDLSRRPQFFPGPN